MSSIDLGQVATILQPVLTDAAGALASLAVAWGAYLLNRYVHVQVSATNIQVLKDAAATQAGAIVATASRNLQGEVVTSKNPLVTAAAGVIADQPKLQAAMEAEGITEASIAAWVAGEIGKIQPPPLPNGPTFVAKPGAT